MFKQYVRTMLLAGEMSLRHTATDLFVLFTVVVQPMIVATLALWMLQGQGDEYAIFIMIGSGMTGLWSGVLFMGGNSVTNERWTGTLEMLAAVPTPLQVIVFGKNLANVIQSLLSMVGSYILASLFFGYALRVAQPGLFAISLVLTVVALVSFGLVLSPIFLMNPSVQSFQNGMEFPVFILSGFLFPIALLPGWTTPLSYLLPTYWAAQALHVTAAGGASLQQVGMIWGLLLLFTVIYIVISARLFRAVLRKVRIDATLSAQ